MSRSYTDYDQQANKFAKLPDYSIHCGTDYLALKEIPSLIKKLNSAHKMLDLGCGSGLATRFLKKHFPEASIIGADINKMMLEQAMLADPKGLYIHLPQSKQQIIYPFLTHFFDVITCSFVLHENKTLPDLKQFLSHIANLLRPGGLLLAWDVNQQLFQGHWLSIKTIFPLQGPVQDGDRYTVKILPAEAEVTGTYWSPETLSKLAESVNLQIVQINYPIAENNSETTWRDETRLAPYFVLEAKKKM